MTTPISPPYFPLVPEDLQTNTSLIRLCDSLLNNRSRACDFNVKKVKVLAELDFYFRPGQQRGGIHGKWAAYLLTLLPSNEALEGREFCSFKRNPDGIYKVASIKPKEENFFREGDEHWGCTLYYEDAAADGLYRDGKAGNRRNYYASWNIFNDAEKHKVRFFTSEDALATVVALWRNQHDLFPHPVDLHSTKEGMRKICADKMRTPVQVQFELLSRNLDVTGDEGNDFEALVQSDFAQHAARLWHWSSVVISYYYSTLGPANMEPTRIAVVQASSPEDRSVVGTFVESYAKRRLQWTRMSVQMKQQLIKSPGHLRKGPMKNMELYVETLPSDGLHGVEFNVLWKDVDSRRVNDFYLLSSGPVSDEVHFRTYLEQARKVQTRHVEQPNWVLDEPAKKEEEYDSRKVMVCLDVDGYVRDRVVVESVGKIRAEAACDPSELTNIPRDISMHRIFNDKPLGRVVRDEKNLVPLIAESYNYSDKHKPYKLYKEYAPHGTLRQLIKLYKRKRDEGADGSEYDSSDVSDESPRAKKQATMSSKGAVADGDALAESTYLPELFLWHMFHKLVAIAALLRDTEEHDHAYINTNFHPSNIHLIPGVKNDFKHYPRPSLSSLASLKHLAHESHQPTDHSRTGFRSLEQRGPQFPTPVTKTDIFQIGLTMFCLLYRSTHGIDLEATSVAETLQDAATSLAYDSMYSVALQELVEACLQEDVDARIGFKELREKVERGLAACDVAWGQPQTGGWEDVHPFDRVRWVRDELKIGELYRPRRLGGVVVVDTPGDGEGDGRRETARERENVEGISAGQQVGPLSDEGEEEIGVEEEDGLEYSEDSEGHDDAKDMQQLPPF